MKLLQIKYQSISGSSTPSKESSRGKYCNKGRELMSGWLFKLRRSHDGDNAVNFKKHITLPWSRRYFVIEKDNLKWYATKSKKHVIDFVNFLQITSIRVANSETRLKDNFNRDEYGTYGVLIGTNSRSLSLRVEDRFQAKRWVDSMRETLKRWTGRDGRETLAQLKKYKSKGRSAHYRLKPRNSSNVKKRKILSSRKKEHLKLKKKTEVGESLKNKTDKIKAPSNVSLKQKKITNKSKTYHEQKTKEILVMEDMP